MVRCSLPPLYAALRQHRRAPETLALILQAAARVTEEEEAAAEFASLAGGPAGVDALAAAMRGMGEAEAPQQPGDFLDEDTE